MKKQSYIYYLFWALLLIQIILTIMIWWSQGLVLPLVVLPGLSFYFLLYLRYLLRYNLNQSPSEPLFVLRRYGLGTSLNPRNPIGYKLSFLVVVGVLVLLFCLTLLAFLGKQSLRLFYLSLVSDNVILITNKRITGGKIYDD